MGTLEEMLRGQSLICEKPGEEVRIEDLGSDWEDKVFTRQTERQEFRYQPKGKKTPGRSEARKDQAAAEEERKRNERKLRKGKWIQGWDIREDENLSGDLFHIQERQVHATQVKGTSKEQRDSHKSRPRTTQTEPEPPV